MPLSVDPLDGVNIFDLPTYNILLTGYDRFRSTKRDNPSFLTVQSLPETLYFTPPSSMSSSTAGSKPVSFGSPPPTTTTTAPPSSRGGTNAGGGGGAGGGSYRVRLFKYPAALRVSYAAVLEAIPSIYGSTHFHYILHVGQGYPTHFTLETVGRRDGYVKPDVDWKKLDASAGQVPGWWAEMPGEIVTGVDADAVVRLWRAGVTGRVSEGSTGGKRGGFASGGGGGGSRADWMRDWDSERHLRKSEDAGRYLCDFIFYSSLAECKRRLDGGGRRTDVVFMHVPLEVDGEGIGRNRLVAEELIHALITSAGGRDGGKAR